jgi:hypothetical protein
LTSRCRVHAEPSREENASKSKIWSLDSSETEQGLVLKSYAWRCIEGAHFHKRAVETALPLRRRREVGFAAMVKETRARSAPLTPFRAISRFSSGIQEPQAAMTGDRTARRLPSRATLIVDFPFHPVIVRGRYFTAV